MENYDIEKILDTKASKMNFLNGLILLSKIDGKIDKSEEQFFLNAAAGLGLHDEINTLKENIGSNNLDVNITFINKKQALFFVREAVQLAYLDNKYTKEEKNLIHQIADSHKISITIVSQIEKWVEDGIKWKNLGDQLLNMEM